MMTRNSRFFLIGTKKSTTEVLIKYTAHRQAAKSTAAACDAQNQPLMLNLEKAIEQTATQTPF